MKKIFFMALAAIALGACNSEPKFKVEGEVSGADGKMLYLEASALEGIVRNFCKTNAFLYCKGT